MAEYRVEHERVRYGNVTRHTVYQGHSRVRAYLAFVWCWFVLGDYDAARLMWGDD